MPYAPMHNHKGSLLQTVLRALAVVFGLCVFSQAVADDTEKLRRIFEEAKDGYVNIPAGIYRIGGGGAIRISSGTTVIAEGAVFVFPEKLPEKARVVMFEGTDIKNFKWTGGTFRGNVFDPESAENPWEPNVHTRGILITTSEKGHTENISFSGISSDGVAGAAVSVFGYKSEDGKILNFAENISISGCNFRNTGKFMWDYGYLWEIAVWPEDFSARERLMAKKYFPWETTRMGLSARSGDDKIFFDNSDGAIKVSKLPSDSVEGDGHDRGRRDTLCFYGQKLPKNIAKGKEYFVVESTAKYIKVSETLGGKPVVFDGDGEDMGLISDLWRVHYALYAPEGSDKGKGAFDFMFCKDLSVSACKASASGDAMHIYQSRNISVTGCQITGARMGAFFLAQFCENAVITGNTVEGKNGSRVLSVEKSCKDVVITCNTFRNGGRGTWINQPRNLILSDNIFVRNTGKCAKIPGRGRRGWKDADYESYPEIYFSRYEKDGRYGSIIMRGNIFESDDYASCAVKFSPGGDEILVESNIFKGKAKNIIFEGCSNLRIRDNIGASVKNE